MKPRGQERRGAGGESGALADAGGLGIAGRDGREDPSPSAAAKPGGTARRGCVVYLHSDAVGGADPECGRRLMRSFLYTLTEIAPQPEAILLVGAAVRLARPGAKELEYLALMQEQGVPVLLAEDSVREIDGGVNPAVGRAATMHAILDTMLRAEKVITL